MVTTECKQCGENFKTYPCRLKVGKATFCGKECQGEWLSENQTGKDHPMYGQEHTEESKQKMRESSGHQTGEENPRWKGGRYKSKGYVYLHREHMTEEEREKFDSMIRSSDKQYIPEHRLVMARHLGRPLGKDDIVHHRNGVKDDNRIENLQLKSQDTHTEEHQEVLKELQEVREENEKLRKELKELRSKS